MWAEKILGEWVDAIPEPSAVEIPLGRAACLTSAAWRARMGKTLEEPALEGSPGRYRPGNFLHLFRHASQAVSAIGSTIAIGGLLA